MRRLLPAVSVRAGIGSVAAAIFCGATFGAARRFHDAQATQVRDRERDVSIRCRTKQIGRAVAAFLMALALSGAAPVQPASAQGLLDVLFGNFHQRRAPLPPRVSAYSDPFGFGDERSQRRAPTSSNYGGPSHGGPAIASALATASIFW